MPFLLIILVGVQAVSAGGVQFLKITRPKFRGGVIIYY